MKIQIRPVQAWEYRTTEEVSRSAFWNIYFPGADAHYLIHKIRSHSDFIPELDYVATVDKEVVGSIVYTRSNLIDARGGKQEIVTFGPISVLPNWQRQGIGSMLIETTEDRVKEMGFKAIAIYGNPTNYTKFGFRGSRSFKITNPEGKFPCSLLVKELEIGTLGETPRMFSESEVFQIDEGDAERFDQGFESRTKGYHHKQEEFRILSRAFLEE